MCVGCTYGLALLLGALAAVAGGAFAAPAAGTATGEKRLALVVGNADYPNAPLRNPVNDARDLAAALSDSGFEVIRLENANLRQMRTAVREFGDRLKQQRGVGLFYFAGHGMQLKGRNFLIPVGAQIEREDEIEFEGLDANLVLEKLDAAGNRFNIVILDACRNNPFARAFRSTAQGLAQMDAPSGTVIAFATAPGSVASDGPGRNGLYSQHLVEFVARPGLKIEDVFKQVRAAVRRDSSGQQVPWESTSLEGDFYFHPVGTAAAEAARRQEEQVRLEAMVRDAVAKERERMRREIEKAARVERGPAPKLPAAATPSLASAEPDLAKGAAAVAPGSGAAPTARVIGNRIDGPIAAPRFVVGDEWELLLVASGGADPRSESTSVIDRWTVTSVSGERLGLAHTRVVKPGGAPLERADIYAVTPALATLFEGRNAFDGKRRFLSFPLEVAARWSYSYEWTTADRAGRFRDDVDCVVVGWEPATVPAGTFWTLRVEEKGWSANLSPNAPPSARSAARIERTIWYSPDVKYAVKVEYRRSNPSVPTSAPNGTAFTTRQLVRYAVATSDAVGAARAPR